MTSDVFLPIVVTTIAITLSLLLLIRLVNIFTPRPITTMSIPTLPTETQLSYLAEGAANVIYRLTPPSRFLLRLRKTLASSQPNLSAYNYLSTTAYPLFPAHLLLTTTLIRLPPSLISSENIRLKALEASGQRPKKRHGMYLETEEEYGFLVADMTPYTPRQILVEFKPKWVVQSPSAPEGAKRCRTCALRAMKRQGGGFCPLDLASGEKRRVARAVEFILPTKAPKGFEVFGGWEEERKMLREKVIGFLLEGELMEVLKGLQRRLDPEGPLGSMREGFTDAMTVRDLTAFLRVDMDVDPGVECGVGDLDMKTKEGGKEEYWRATEKMLIEEGWYDSKGSVCEL